MVVCGRLFTKMLLFAISLTVFLLTVVPVSDSKSDSLKICVAGNSGQKGSQAMKSCEQLARSKKTRATCIFGVDRLDCLRQISERKADLTVLEAEDLMLAAESKAGVLIVAEVRGLPKQDFEYSGVVVVRKVAKVRPDLRGAALCHPGSTPQDGRGGLFTLFLEERLAPQACNTNLSLLEDRTRASADYFGRSCKPGLWSADPEEDARLKMLYPGLCGACDSDCATRDKFWGEGGAVTCLQENAGDVLWTTYKNVRIHFLHKLSQEDLDAYELLCMDGSRKAIRESVEPCVWLARPWQTVVANSKMAADVQKTLSELNDDDSTDWEDNLISVFDAHKEHIHLLETSKPPEDYLETIPGYVVANEQARANCKPPFVMTWCTTSASEHRKCTWIARAAEAFSVAPAIHCVQHDGMERCMASVARMESDVVVVPADFQPIALSKHNLEALLFEEFKAAGAAYSLSAVVRQGSPVRTPAYMRSRKVCLTMHEGLVWRAVLVALRDDGLVSGSCSATNVLHNFFGQICVAMASENETLPVCCNGKFSSYQPDTAVLKCLVDDGCEIAFANNATFLRDSDAGPFNQLSGLQSHDFRHIARSSTEKSWAWSAPSAVMGSARLPFVRKQEIRHVFSEISRLFVRRNKAKNLVLAVFGPFQDERNVIFQDTSSDFTPTSLFVDKRASLTHSMMEIFNATKYCSSAPRHVLTMSVVVILALILLR